LSHCVDFDTTPSMRTASFPLAMIAVLGIAACATGRKLDETPADASGGGDDTAPPDASSNPMPDTPGHPDAPGPSGTSLLITEVALAPTAGELIEIANPTDQTIDLSTYYLSDSGHYFELPAGAPAVDSSDFIARFPAGAQIAPGGVVTVALDTTANFQATYGIAPDFSIASGTMTVVASTSTPTLTNAGELVVLFEWSGQSDLVNDVDMLLVGVPSVANGLIDKSGQSFDGPDADSTPSTYADDVHSLSPQIAAPGAGTSTKRIELEVNNESHGGNGIDGDDETSENTAATWDSQFTAPTPGSLPHGLIP